MPSLSDRLQALGVKVGTGDLPASMPPPKPEHPIQVVLPGKWWQTPNGGTFYVDTRYGADFRVGEISLKTTASLDMIAAWAKTPALAHLHQEQFAFIDIESTGLYGGSGIFAFLIGVARFEGDHFRLAQFFLQDPAQETAQLAALESFLSPCEALVSFNGKTFDIPILNARYIINGFPSPLSQLPHLDLLHLSRRIWKARLPSRTLGDLEVQILGAKRSEEDVPGWMIPDLYFDYLQTGDARPLRGVFYHNEIDVVSLAALLNHLSDLISNPLDQSDSHSLDIISVGKLYAHLGRLRPAVDIYTHALEKDDLPQTAHWEAVKQLSFIHKKLGEWRPALKLWEHAACAGAIYAHEELAKFFEHRERKFEVALDWTKNALEILSQGSTPLSDHFDSTEWQHALEHRAKRLERRIARKAP